MSLNTILNPEYSPDLKSLAINVLNIGYNRYIGLENFIVLIVIGEIVGIFFKYRISISEYKYISIYHRK